MSLVGERFWARDAVQFVIHKHLLVPDLNVKLTWIKSNALLNTVDYVNSPIVCILLTRIWELSIDYIKLFAVVLWFEFS